MKMWTQLSNFYNKVMKFRQKDCWRFDLEQMFQSHFSILFIDNLDRFSSLDVQMQHIPFLLDSVLFDFFLVA